MAGTAKEGFSKLALGEYLSSKMIGNLKKTCVSVVSEKESIRTSHYEKEIAVIAMDGIFPQATDIEEYWENILNGNECFDKLSIDECRSRGVPDELVNNKNFVPISGIVDDIDKFDYAFWNFSFNDALLIDPQIRKFLECSWHVLEQSGYIRNRKEQHIGVFAGMSASKYYESRILNNSSLAISSMTFGIEHLNEKDYLTTRISYLLGLKGPSLNINTACSTSLVAIIEACKNLTFGFCDMALAGGVSLPLPEHHGYFYQEGMIFSKDGRCNVFDKDASGTVPGAGVGVVVLKRLSDAVRDNDHIIAVIKGYAINNDGDKKIGYTAPSITGQSECILQAQRNAGVTSDTIGYIECHGTGTPIGDPIEIAALHDAFSGSTKTGQYNCYLGSVKANIGHAASAAGVAGFMKVCKMLKNKVIPAQICFSSPNQNIQLNKTNFIIPKTLRHWEQISQQPRRAGVSSFGFGGTNAHIILEEYESCAVHDILTTTCFFGLPISAASQHSCKKYGLSLANYLEKNPDISLGDVAHTLQFKREQLIYRSFILCHNRTEAIRMLRSLASPIRTNKSENDTVMMFPGQGAQYFGMAAFLYEAEPIFKKHVDHCCTIISPIINYDFAKILFSKNGSTIAETDFVQTKLAQPSLFVICYALARLLHYFGVHPKAYIGHSIGEYVAATLAGVFVLDDVLPLIIERATLMQNIEPGAMLSISAPAQEIENLLVDGLFISLFNAPQYTVVSGNKENIGVFEQTLKTKKINYVKLNTSHAFHCEIMRPAAERLKKHLDKITLREPKERFVSNVTGKFITIKQAISSEYWAEHMCKPVLFEHGINTLILEYKNLLFIEIGPGHSLSNFVTQCAHRHKCSLPTVYTLPSKKTITEQKVDDREFLYSSIGKLWQFGYPITWNFLNDVDTTGTHNFVKIPCYQFEKNECWLPLPRKIGDGHDGKNNNVTLEKNPGKKGSILIEDDVSDLEIALAGLFTEILGNKQLSKFDSFFDLGGNSLSSVNFTELLNQQLNLQIPLSAIFQYRTIAQLAEYISLVRKNYCPIVQLNDTSAQHKMFMIHPGLGGCEVYIPLAKKIGEIFSCYGIDSYNMYHTEKIGNLHSLALLYLQYIKESIRENAEKKQFIFLGWSLGGLIALEIAGILEQENITDTRVYLLDTLIDDKHLSSLKTTQYKSHLEDTYAAYLKQNNYSEAFIAKAVPNIGIALQFEKSGITHQLAHTDVTLFKAMLIDPNIADDKFLEIYHHSTGLRRNNVDSVMKNQNNLSVYECPDAHHNNILEKTYLITKVIREKSLKRT